MNREEREERVAILELKGTELLVYDLPDDLIGGHDNSGGFLQIVRSRSKVMSKTIS